MPDKKNILIIGASSEIAQGIAQELKITDAYTILTTTREGGSDFTLELTSDSSIEEFKKNIAETPLSWVFYCAGFIEPQESTEIFDSNYGERSKKINFESAVNLLQTLIPQIESHGGIVCLSSTAGIWGNPDFPLYSTWKGALNIYLQSLSKKLSETGTYVFSICPGPTNTRMRQLVAGDASEHQSPLVVAKHIITIINQPENYKDSPLLIIRNGTLFKVEHELHSLL